MTFTLEVDDQQYYDQQINEEFLQALLIPSEEDVQKGIQEWELITLEPSEPIQHSTFIQLLTYDQDCFDVQIGFGKGEELSVKLTCIQGGEQVMSILYDYWKEGIVPDTENWEEVYRYKEKNNRIRSLLDILFGNQKRNPYNNN